MLETIATSSIYGHTRQAIAGRVLVVSKPSGHVATAVCMPTTTMLESVAMPFAIAT